jgi:ubiquinone/menaquinone biosynthesis C-methylase UbiE
MKLSRRIRSLFLLFMAAVAALFVPFHEPLYAQTPAAGETSVKPGINKEYLKPGLDVSKWVAKFEKPGREVFDQREKILEALHLKPGQRVADIGAGTGLFTMLIANAVGLTGKVYSVDIVKDFLAHINDRAAEAGLKNIQTVLGTDRSVELPENSVDLAFCSDVYHHFEYPRSVLASIRRALRPDGALVVVDYRREPGKSPEWILHHVRAGQEEVAREIEDAGFKREETPEFLKQNYLMRFRKK